jgi:predicted CoA-binding protein
MSQPTIAVIGASCDRRKFGNKCVRAYLHAGYRVFPVNLREVQIEGLTVVRTIDEVPTELDRISVYLLPEKTRTLIPSLTQRPETQVWFNPCSADRQILDQAQAAGIDVHDGCSIVDIGLSPGQFP